MPKITRADAAPPGRARARAHAPSAPPRTNASKPVRRARLSAAPGVERSAWSEIEGLLAAGHRRLEQQFSRAAKLAAKDADSLGQAGARLISGVRSHFDLKVGAVYPVLYETLPDAGVILEAEIEIEVARDLMRRLEGMKPFDERYQPTMNILAAWMGRHFEQERVRLFAAARRSLPAFARRLADVRARFAQDAAVLADGPAAAGTATERPSIGRALSPAKPRRPVSAAGRAPGRAGLPAAGFAS